MKLFFRTLIVLIIILGSACKYKWTTVRDTKGHVFFTREYKNYNDQERYAERMFFKYRYHFKIYPKYSGNISTIMVDSFLYVQFDSTRAGRFYGDLKDYIALFSSGLINNQLIYCTLDSLCRPPSPMLRTEITSGKIILPHMGDWYGNVINIGLIEEPEHLKASPQCRRFKLWINPTYGGHGYYVFYVELQNKEVNTYVDIENFVKRASVTFIISPWQVI